MKSLQQKNQLLTIACVNFKIVILRQIFLHIFSPYFILIAL